MAQSAQASDDPLRLWVIEWRYPETPAVFDPIWFTIGDAIEFLRGIGIEPPAGASEYNDNAPWHTFEGWDRYASRIESQLNAIGNALRPYQIARDEAVGALERLDIVRREIVKLPLPGTNSLHDEQGRSCGAIGLVVARASDRVAVEKLFPHLEDRFEDWESRAGWARREIEMGEDAYKNLFAACSGVPLTPVAEKDVAQRYAREMYGHIVPGKNDPGLLSHLPGLAAAPGNLARVAATVERLGWNWKSVEQYLDSRTRPAPRIKFVVDGLLPRQAVSILVGSPKIGKSTLALQIALEVALGRSVLGSMTVPSGDGLVIYFSGEDSEAVLSERVDQMLGGAVLPERLIVNCQPGPIDRLLAQYDGADVALVIIDTAARYTQGSVSDGGHVRAFLGPIDDFAKRSNCAVLIIHHVNKPGKSGPPRSAEAVLAAMKGSGEFLSAPRVFIALFEAGADRVLQVARANMPSSVPMRSEPLRLSFDSTTGAHTPSQDQTIPARARSTRAGKSNGEQPSPAASAVAAKQNIDPNGDARQVAAAVRAAIAVGRKAPRTGPGEPHTWGEATLAGWPRKRVRDAHRRALDMGLLDHPNGFLGGA